MEILTFNKANFAKALSDDRYTPKDVIRKKNHFIYFFDYLNSSEIGAKKIVIEEDYISKDFLEDYTSYYALCFEKYPKFCKRIHIFSNSFSKTQLTNILLASEKKQEPFFKNYLGFIVVKPIPTKNIGYSVIKHFPSGAGFNERNFWGTRDYKVHFFGKEIRLDSLAFQEQDSVMAACATTAIWSMLNKASVDYHTILKSPSEITKDAASMSPDGSRLFPNKGLDILQICQAIHNSGLVSEVKGPDTTIIDPKNGDEDEVISNLYLKKILNAYAPIGIPIILVVDVPASDGYGLHAITVSGSHTTSPKAIKPKKQIAWLAENVEKIYAHDDQWGPFVRVDFTNLNEVKTPWTDHDIQFRPTYVKKIILPLYPKIRISYEDIEALVLGIDRILTFMFNASIKADLVWDVKIEFSEKYKEEIKNSFSLSNSRKIEILTSEMPKYIWVARCYIGATKLFDFTFDATNVSSGMYGKDIIVYIDELKGIFKDYLNLNKKLFLKKFKHRSSIRYYDFMVEKLS